MLRSWAKFVVIGGQEFHSRFLFSVQNAHRTVALVHYVNIRCRDQFLPWGTGNVKEIVLLVVHMLTKNVMLEEIYEYGYEINSTPFSQTCHVYYQSTFNVISGNYFFKSIFLYVKCLVFYDLVLQFHHMWSIWQIYDLPFC